MQCPWGSIFGMPKLGGNTFFKSLGDEMLQTLGLFMHFVDWIIEHLVEKCLDQPMVTHDLERSLLPRCGEQNAAMPLVFH